MINENRFVTISVLAAAALAGMALFAPAEAQEQTTTPQQNVNLTQVFEEQIPRAFVTDAWVVYQSPATVILEGNVLTLTAECNPECTFGEGYMSNVYLWQGVDIVKSYGYRIDAVTMSGTGTSDNMLEYHIVMSK